MKKFMKLIPALAMLLIATTLVSTATFAWFSMNTTVEAVNMQVRAVAEKGLLINEVATAGSQYWDEQATANQTAANPVLLYPASTNDLVDWYHGASKKSNDEAGATASANSDNLIGTYEDLNDPAALVSITSSAAATEGTQAARAVMGRAAADTVGYYVKYTYYLKGASGSAIGLGTAENDMNVKITSVVATPAAATGNTGTYVNSTNLDKSLRVGIKLGNGDAYIFAPISGYSPATYYVGTAHTATTPIAGGAADTMTAVPTDLQSLPAIGSDGVAVDVYVWYEGEDVNCMSDNALAATLDNIDIDITFKLEAVTAAEAAILNPGP